MAALEEPPHRGQAVQIYSRSSGGWISSTVEAVDGEEATVLYNADGREMRKVVDWDDPEQLIAAGPGQAVGPSVGASSPAPQSTTTPVVRPAAKILREALLPMHSDGAR